MASKKVKVEKDYHIIKHYAKKIAGVCEFGKDENGKKDKNLIVTYFKYGVAAVLVSFGFEKKRCVNVSYELTEIYDLYGKNKYANVKDFASAFCQNANWYDVDCFSEYVEVKTNLTEQDIDPVALSQGLDDVSLFMYAMNKFLSRHETIINEKHVRSINVEYMKKQKNLFAGVVIGGLVLFALGIILAIATNNGATSLLMIAGILAGLYGLIRFLYYKKMHEKAVRLYKKIKY